MAERSFTAESIDPQFESPLFSVLPPEIRTSILEYALKDYEVKTAMYSDKTCYKRPECRGRRRIDTAVLETCKLIYSEAWHLPLATAEHMLYLTWGSRSPPHMYDFFALQEAIDAVHDSHPNPTIKHVQVYAQLCVLEDGPGLRPIVNLDHFNPEVITLTIRHTDWWEWENDSPLRVGAKWVNKCRAPTSLKEFRIAFESLERKRDQVDQIATQAIERWEFEKKDGVIMSAEGCVPKIMRWSGNSTWGDSRWVRDETKSGQVDYYIATVTWAPVRPLKAASSIADSQAEDLPSGRKKKEARDLQAIGNPIKMNGPSFSVRLGSGARFYACT